MFIFITIAIRNILRNTKRSLITLSAIGFGLGALIFIWSFVEGAHQQMVNNYTSLTTSPLVIHQKGFHKQQKLENHISNPLSIVKKIQQQTDVKAASPRVRAVGLASSSESSSGVMILGVQPSQEKNVSRLSKHMSAGAFLNDDSHHDIVIGDQLAESLNIGLDEKIVLMSQAADGSIAAGAYYVTGIMDTGTEEIDKSVVLITIKAAQDLFVLGDAATDIAISVNTITAVPAVKINLQKSLADANLEILAWDDVDPGFKQWIEFDNAFVWIIVMVIMIVVAIGILNTVLMGVLERTREFGILLALGTKRKEIVIMVAWESVFLGFIGSLIGAAIGGTLVAYFNHAGLDLTIFSSALNAFYMDAMIYPQLNIGYTLASLCLVLLTSIGVSIYPAWYAAHLKPIEAIRSL